MPQKSAKEMTVEESQLDAILNYVRKPALTMALPAALRERITTRLSIPDHDIYADKLLIYDVVEFSLCELMCQSLGGTGGDIVLTGLIFLWMRYCAVIHRRKSKRQAYNALVEPNIAEAIWDRIKKHNQMMGREMVITRDQMQKTLTRLHTVHEKTAGKYEEPAMKSIILYLGDSLQELFDLISSHKQPETTVIVQANDLSDPAIGGDLAALIQDYTQSRCSMSPPACGISLPISDCIRRSLHIRGEPHVIPIEYLANHLANRRGTIAGCPGMGVSTVMRHVAVIGNCHNLYGCRYFYFSLLLFHEKAKMGYSFPLYIASELDINVIQDAERCSQLVEQIEEWLTNGRLVVLADDLERLDLPAQIPTIAKLASAKAIYFATSPWLDDKLLGSMRRLFDGDFLEITLDGLDADARDLVARVAARTMNILYSAGSISAEFDSWNAVEATTALGVLTALRTQWAPAESKHLIFAHAFLSEHLQRHGFPTLTLPQQVYDLDALALRLIRMGRAAREATIDYETEKLFDYKANARLTVPLSPQAWEEITGDSIPDLHRLRLLRPFNRWANAYLLFVFPAVEELLMTLDFYYFQGCKSSWLDHFRPRVKSPILRRVEQSSALVPQLFQPQEP